MKKNILTVVILSLAIINVVLSTLIIFVIVPTSMKTNNLIKQIASIIELEVDYPNGEKQITVDDLEYYNIEGDIQVNLKSDPGDTKNHYAVLTTSLAINKSSEDYQKYKDTITTNERAITDMINDVVSQYSFSEAKTSKAKMKEEILTKIQEYYKSDFIVNVNFGKFVFQ